MKVPLLGNQPWQGGWIQNIASPTQPEAEDVSWEGSLRRRQCSWQVLLLTCQHSLCGEQWNGSAEAARVRAKESTLTAAPVCCRSVSCPRGRGIWPQRWPGAWIYPKYIISTTQELPPQQVHPPIQEADPCCCSTAHPTYDLYTAACRASHCEPLCNTVLCWDLRAAAVGMELEAEVTVPAAAECSLNQSFQK